MSSAIAQPIKQYADLSIGRLHVSNMRRGHYIDVFNRSNLSVSPLTTVNIQSTPKKREFGKIAVIWYVTGYAKISGRLYLVAITQRAPSKLVNLQVLSEIT
ncbi:MAG: hypothetical protein H6797_02350 [Candidatus Nomurabacteria bacterium]|nr:MAG: hypothetical protein H6797_02350 [Candidatus Nomurabacteria bacterium]